MQMHKRICTKILSLALSGILSTAFFPAAVYAANSGNTPAEGKSLTECHAAHENCGYIEASQEQPCSHLNEDGMFSCEPIKDADEASSSNADEAYTCNHNDGCGYEAATDGSPCEHRCELCEKAPLESALEVPEPDIPVTEVNLEGREFSITASVGDAPYYQVFMFTTPDNAGGSYTFYSEYIDSIDSYGYLCTENQYKALCLKIEEARRHVSAGNGECLISNDDGGSGYNFYINYNLEENTTYYFIGTRYYSDEIGQYKLVFMRDIQIDLDHEGAASAGTETLYSKGNLWYPTSNRNGNPITTITKPEKQGYLFDGYYTEEDGAGTQILDANGTIMDAIDTISINTTLYAKWVIDPDTMVYTLTVNDSCAAITGAGSYLENTEVSISAGSRDGYTFNNWTSSDGIVFADEGSEATTFTMPAKAVTVTANWTSSTASSSSSSGGSDVWTSLPQSYQGGTKLIGNVRVPDYTVEGSWDKNDNGIWSFTDKTGKLYADCWAPLYNPYAKITNGQSAFDWFKFDTNGNMLTGWYTDDSQNTYYLNTDSNNTLGAMLTGWVLIDGKYYYFNEKPDGTRGTMLKCTTTPDGYTVDANGVCSDKK